MLPTRASHHNVAESLSRCPLFHSCSSLEIHEVAAITHRKFHTKDDYLFYEGNAARAFYLVESGSVKIHRLSFAGKEQVLHITRQYESFGEEALLSNDGHLTNASVLEPSQILMIQKAGFIELVRKHPDLALSVLRAMNQKYCDLLTLLDDLTGKDVGTRFANWLLHQCPNPRSRKPVRIQMAMTKRTLASELGTIAETFSRTLARFRNQNLLTVEGRTVVVLCPERLARMIGSLG